MLGLKSEVYRAWHPFEDRHLCRFGNVFDRCFLDGLYTPPWIVCCSPFLRAVGNDSWAWLSLGCFRLPGQNWDPMSAKVFYLDILILCGFTAGTSLHVKQTVAVSANDLLDAPQDSSFVAHVGAVTLEELEACGFDEQQIRSLWDVQAQKKQWY